MKFPTLTLPDDALICVFCFLPARTLLESVQLVSKRFKELASIDWIWRGIYKKSFAYSLLHHDQISNLMMDEEEESTTAFKLSYIYKSNLEKNWKNSSTCDFVPQALRVSQFQAKIDTTQMGAKGIHCLKYVRRSPSSQYTGNPDALDIFVGCGPNICLYRCLYKAEQEACEEILEEDQNDEAAALMSREIETCRAVKLQEYKGHNLMVWCMDINYNRMKDKLVSSGIDDSVIIWNTKDATVNAKIEQAHVKGIWNVKVLDSTSIVTVGNDALVKFFDVTQGKHVSTLYGHKASIFDVECMVEPSASSVDTLITGGGDSCLRFWDRRAQSSVGTMETNCNIYELCYHHASNALLVGTDQGVVNMYDTRKIDKNDSAGLMYSMPIFKDAPAIRGLFYDGSKIVAGSKYGIAKLAKGSGTSAVDANCSFIDYAALNKSASPFKRISYIEQEQVICLAADEELLLSGTLNDEVTLYNHSQLYTLDNYDPNAHSCSVQ